METKYDKNTLVYIFVQILIYTYIAYVYARVSPTSNSNRRQIGYAFAGTFTRVGGVKVWNSIIMPEWMARSGIIRKFTASLVRVSTLEEYVLWTTKMRCRSFRKMKQALTPTADQYISRLQVMAGNTNCVENPFVKLVSKSVSKNAQRKKFHF